MEVEKGCQAGLVENLLLNLKTLSSAVQTKIGINFETPPIDQIKSWYFGSKRETEAFRKHKWIISSSKKDEDEDVKKTLLYSTESSVPDSQ